ncbi:Fe-S cluster assembly ATPase SufC [bacterium]|nr:Fe-S cluster assembly ATPase SufC [bacterium]
MIFIQNYSVQLVGTNQVIIQSLSVSIEPGFVHALMGPNGSGKSTFAASLMGHHAYQVTADVCTFLNQNIVEMPVCKRAQAGLFLAFQHPQAVPGLKVFTFLKDTYSTLTGNHVSAQDFYKQAVAALQAVGLDESFLDRHVHVGFSGGQKKALEVAQILLCKPRFIILDEIDSGLDIDALKMIGNALQQYKMQNPHVSFLVITHYSRILQYLVPDVVHVLKQGTIVQSGDISVLQNIENFGYDAF